ncbi:MAG: glycine--tRNA ligase [Methanobacterium sp.]|nr:glycine--tRNA ligase [Methanobacterium sp.]
MTDSKIMNIAKKRGYLWSSFEIYSGSAGFFDYGPLGAILKNNIIEKWRNYYITHEGFYEIESPTIMPEEALKASGHVDHFTDPMTECKECMEVYRADHIIEAVLNKDVEGQEDHILTKILSDKQIKCPKCGGPLTHVWSYNLMFQTLIGAKGKKTGYMRPETAQGIFIPFKRLLRFFRGKLPFGVVQIGKAYRNEISPRQGVIRLREFTQAEAEIFVDPKNKTHPKFNNMAEDILTLFPSENQLKKEKTERINAKKAVEEGLISSEILTYQLCLAARFLSDLGIPADVIRFRQHLPTEMAHYAIDCWDVEVKTDRFGWIEIIGIADRTDFDLKSHGKHSNEDLSVFIEYNKPKTVTKLVVKHNMKKFGPLFKADAPKIINKLEDLKVSDIQKAFKKEGVFKIEIDGKNYELSPDIISFQEIEDIIRGEKVIPHVIEPSYGIDRIIYTVLLHSYTEYNGRSFLKLEKGIAPIKVAVFPLLNNEDMVKIAHSIKDEFRNQNIISEYDGSGTIGRRYARCDEIGIPFAVTVDHETLEDNTVTIRNRNNLKQTRIPIKNIYDVLKDLIEDNLNFEDI